MKNKLAFLYFIIFILHQIIENAGIKFSLIDSYLDDFLFLPLFLFSIEIIISFLSKNKFSLTITQKWVVIIFTIIIVEILFPFLSKRFVFDYWDFLAYGLGYIFYIGILNYSADDKIKIT